MNLSLAVSVKYAEEVKNKLTIILDSAQDYIESLRDGDVEYLKYNGLLEKLYSPFFTRTK